MEEIMVCGTCKYSVYNDELGDFCCTCEDSDDYGLELLYDNSCECYEEYEG